MNISLLKDTNDEDAFIKLLVDEAVNSKAIDYVEEWLQWVTSYYHLVSIETINNFQWRIYLRR